MKELIAGLLSKHVKLKKEELMQAIEIPPDSSLGDYAFPCFILARELRKKPVDISTELARELTGTLPKEISGVKAQGAYLNFFIDKKILAEKTIAEIINKKGNYGKGKQKGKIVIEHTSINPNASPHVGRIRNSLIGDSIKRILEFSGLSTETHFYVNDVSKQVALLCLSTKIKKFSDLLSEYIRLSKQENEEKIFQLLNKFEKGDKETVQKFKKIVEIAIKGQKEILNSIGIKFDFFDYESSFLKEAEKVLNELKKTGKLFKDEEGRLVLNQSGTSIENKMKAPYLVLTRSDGTGLYPLRDLAYTIWKMKRAENNLIVLGEDQKLYFEQLKIALEFLKQKAPEVIHYSFVLLQTERGKGKMSTRRGEVVLFEDFLNEAVKKAKKEIEKRKTKGDAKKVAVSAVKFSLLRNEPNRNIIFNLDEALSFEGETGPYLQYSYARASSILKKAKKKANEKVKALEEKEIELVKKLENFPEIVKSAREQLNPSLIANYTFQLAQVFNEFYHSCKVLDSEEEPFRLALVQAFRIVMKSSLYLLGIDIMEEM